MKPVVACLASALLSTLLASTGMLRMVRFTSIRQHDSLIIALENSCLCETSMTTDRRGAAYLAYCDSGHACVRVSPSLVAAPGEGGGNSVAWSERMVLGRGNLCASPVIYELAEPGREPFVVVMWREKAAGVVRVMRTYLYPGVSPPQWGTPLVMGTRAE
jgi:hypothetical protein